MPAEAKQIVLRQRRWRSMVRLESTLKHFAGNVIQPCNVLLKPSQKERKMLHRTETTLCQGDLTGLLASHAPATPRLRLCPCGSGLGHPVNSGLSWTPRHPAYCDLHCDKSRAV